MIQRLMLSTVLFGFIAGALVLAPAPVFGRDPPAVSKLVQMNRRALEDYDKKDWRNAKGQLWEAIAEGKKAGLETHPIMARTYLHLGAVYLVGLKDREAAVQFFGRALRIDPEIRVAAAMETAEIAGAFMEAQNNPPRLRAESESQPPAPEKGEPAPVKASPPQPPPSADDDARPAPSNSGLALDCPNADEIVRDRPATIRCALAPGLKVGSVVLFYRVPGEPTFTAVDMKRSGKGWYTGQIARDVTGGKSVQFYVEGRDPNGKPIVANGRSGSPNLMLVRDATPSEAEPAAESPAAPASPPPDPTADREENPLDAAPGAVVHRASKKEAPGRGAARTWWIGLGLGSGFGYAKGDGLENRKDLQPLFGSGLSWAGLGQASPEIGLHLTPGLALALQGRNQWIPQSGSASKGYATSANAALLRLLWFSQPRGLRFYGGPVAGYGTFRFIFSPPEASAGGGVKDTVKGGRFVAGAGGGLSYELTRSLSFIAETNALLGYSAVSAVCDLNAGLQVNFY